MAVFGPTVSFSFFLSHFFILIYFGNAGDSNLFILTAILLEGD
jgi:hypothetical protein